MNWDLSCVFKNTDEMDKKILALKQDVSKFKSLYKDKLKSLDNEAFLSILKQYEEFICVLSDIYSYAYLCFSTDTTKGAFLSQTEQKCKSIEEELLFFELEFCSLDDEKSKEFASFCTEYEYYLNDLLKNKKHNLGYEAEKVALYMQSSGKDAFCRLFEESLSRVKYNFDDKKLSQEEILSKLSSADRTTRKQAAKSLTKGLKKNINLLAFILNTIKLDHKNRIELRGYESVMAPRNNANKISQKSVDSLIKASEDSFYIVQEYYEEKRKLLNLKELKDYDRYAPIGLDKNYSFDEAKKIVLDSFKSFSTTFYDIAKRAFDEKWIDIMPGKNKQSGAFSCSMSHNSHPFVLLNFTNKQRDVFTLAHELGHSIHQLLSYNVSFLNQHTPLTTAETASVFAEMLVFDSVKQSLNKKEKKALIASKLEDIFATLYRQINFTTFEKALHEKDGEFSVEELNELWMSQNAKTFGKSIKLTKNYAYWWSYISHFIHTPFYCYSYSYAQLLVLALYGLYKSGKCENFLDIYIKFLSSGGSASPKELVGMFGFDIDDELFWQIGINEIKKMLEEFKSL